MKACLWGRAAELPALTAAGAERLCRQALARRGAAAARHIWKTIHVLEETGKLWKPPTSPYRRRAQRLLAGGGFSPRMVDLTLDVMADLFEARSLRRRLAYELGREDALDAWSLDPEGVRTVKAFPLGAVLHVAAGNIFLGCIDSLVMGFLTNNVNVLRMSSADTAFPLLFAESLRRADREGALTRTLAVLSWESGTESVERVFKRRLQGLVVWGGEGAVSAYRRDLGPGCRLVAFGPKLSFGVVTRGGLRRYGAAEAARLAARDVCLWDQAACASPQAVFVQHERPEPFLRELGAHLERAAHGNPPGPLSPDQAADIVEERQRALAAELLGQGRLLAPRHMGWTVTWRRRGALKPSPLHRTVQVVSYRDLDHLKRLIAPASAFLQTAGLLAGPDEAPGMVEALAEAGVTRVPQLGWMLAGNDGEPHDGRYPMSELVRWVSGPPAAVASNEKKALAGLLEQAAHEAPFYKRRLKGKAPLLDKEDLYRWGPPRSSALLTRAGTERGRVVFASGGSTGKPKFCYYTQQEFDETCRWLGWSLNRSGLSHGDVVADLFVAGNLWSSFLAVSGATRLLPVTHLPVGGTAEPAFALDALRRFKATALIGLPSTLLELARHLEKSGRRIPVEKIFYGGEHVSDEMRRYWKKAFGVSLVRSAGYASVDAGLIGFQCREAAGGVHHVAQGLQRVELVDEELVVTNLVRRWMPVIRYRTGDRGRWVEGACPCGHPAPRFELLGRVDDRVNVGGAHLDVNDVGKAVASVPGLGLAYQVVVSDRGGERVTVRVERKDGSAAAGQETRLAAALLAHSLELRDSVRRGWLRPPAIELLAPGGLPRAPRTGKIRRVMDLRR